jgi:hypothetical protein
MTRFKSGFKKLYPLLFFALITVLAYWKVIFHSEFTLLTGGDMCSQSYPWFNVAAYWLKKGTLLLWDPYVFSGKPTLGEVQPGLLYPINWLFMLLPSKDGGMNLHSMEALLILNYFFAGYFCFLLARSFNLTFLGSATAGVVFALGGFMNQVYGYMNIFGGFVHLPLIVYLFHESIKRNNWIDRLRWAFFCALSLGFSFLAGHHVPPIQAGFLLFLFVIFVVIQDRHRKEKLVAIKPFILLCIVALVALFITAAQLVPAMEYAHQAYRWTGKGDPIQWGQKIPYSVLEETGNISPQNVVSLLLPYLGTGVNMYVGPTVLFLVLIGFLKVQKSEAYFFGCTAFLYLFLSFGTFSAIHGWANTFVPGLWFAREVFHYLIPFQLCLGLLSGFGIDYLASQDFTNKSFKLFIGRMQWIIIFSAIFCFSISGVLFFLRDTTMQDLIHMSLARLAIYSFFLAILIFFFRERRIGPVVFGSLLLVLLFIDLSSNLTSEIRSKDRPRGEDNPSVEAYWTKPKAIEFLQTLRQQEYFRVNNMSGTFPANFGDVWRLEETHGHGATMLVRYLDFRSTGWENTSNANALLNTRYFTAPDQPQQILQIYDDDTSIYANPRAVPRAFFPSRYRTFENEQQIRGWISSPLFAPLETVLLLKKDISILPNTFVNQLRNENEDISFQLLSSKREGKLIWGWNPLDQLTLEIAPHTPVKHCFLILKYYPIDSQACDIGLNFRSQDQVKEINLKLDGLKESETKWKQKQIYFDLGNLSVDRSELTISKTADCNANIDSVRVSKDPPPSADIPGTVSIDRYEPNHITLIADVNESSLLLLSEIYYPGWNAAIDSKEVSLLQGNSILRVIPVEKGHHKIEVKFQPRSFRWGAIVSFTTLLAIGLFVFKNR